jgi:hypothetical protein
MTRFERMKIRRRMQRRIRLVVEERRMALADPPPTPADQPLPPTDPDATVEIPPTTDDRIAINAIS